MRNFTKKSFILHLAQQNASGAEENACVSLRVFGLQSDLVPDALAASLESLL